ncbi:MAG TPA: FAD-containing monooxygenase EthA, partial [Solirubrobacteraceae bacterium]|nr:FAD-containing monooxygenase EthA [Solirubrobacteraceae bacterium]
SWTLKADLVAEYICRLLEHMDARGLAVFVAKPPDPSAPTAPIIDLESGYVLRALERLPKQGAHAPWRLHQNYIRDIRLLRHGSVEDAMEFRAHESAAAPATVALAAA